MIPKIALKTLYRSPVRTVLTFILLVAVTFALVSQILEYSVSDREIEKMVSSYDGVFSVETGGFIYTDKSLPDYIYTDERVKQSFLPDDVYEEHRNLGYEKLTQEQIASLFELPYVTYTDTRYMTAGVSDFRRLDESTKYYDYTNICVIEADVKLYNSQTRSISVENVSLVGGEPIPNSSFGENDIIIVSEPTYVFEQTGMNIYYWMNSNRATTVTTVNSIYDSDYLQSLNVGERYVFVLRYEDDFNKRPDVFTYYLTDPFVYGQCEAIYSIENEPENYIDTEKFASLKEYISLIETDQHTLDVVYTKNMNSIRYFAAGTIGVAEGRGLSLKDTEEQNNVCVISHTLAREYGLSVGDIITVDLGNRLFEQNKAVGAVSVVPERAATEYATSELEIVGIFKDTRNKYMETSNEDVAWSYGVNTVFVPRHLLNADEEELANWEIGFGEISFVIENVLDTPTFESEILTQIEEMGYTVYYDDGGFSDIMFSIRETERVAVIKIAILVFAIVVVTWFVSMLYVIGRRRDYAVMRLLGTTKARSASTLILPLSVIAIAAVMIGTIAAYVYTVNTISKSQYLEMLSGVEVNLGVPVWLAVVCVIGEILLTLIISLILISITGRKSPLELMQSSGGGKRRKQRKKKVYAPEPKEPVVLGEWQSIEKLVPDGKNRNVQFVMRYIVRHLSRTLGKVLLFILVTVLLLNVLGQLLLMKDSYVEIFDDIEVTSNFAGCLSLHYVQKLQSSEYVEDVFYCYEKLLSIDRVTNKDYSTTFCNDVKLYAEYNGIEGIEITWLNGYDELSMGKLGNVVIVGEEYLENHGYEIGDTIEVARAAWYDEVVFLEMFHFDYEVKDADKYTNEERIAMRIDEILERYSIYMEEFLIIGSVKDDNGACANLIMTPGSSTDSTDFGTLVIPPFVSAKLKDNWKAEEYRKFGNELAAENGTGEVAFIMDTSKLDNVRNNIELLNTLYPIMVIAVLIIGAFLCGMLIIQNSKDIAIMRVLGTPKRRVRAITVLEYMLLCMVGVILAAVVLTIRGVFIQMLRVAVLYIVIIFLAALVSSVLASRKSILELLQTKE